ncbi:hypothetical protein PISMIDRAFT_686456 [Pisolithus microcarpus 441]|uniref:Uncharacterized protein n=1 Tax=Pisolithus microcarpus 441 TaxID=765257 RepID=A0A0C9XV33_9AGAM|nr:hypothetical protein BKA83DRAFT_686456 [Pisolithus microcarpus]KIK16290.1 hypothetical protein PISMIDRAFT_686456 [Pisolithus microcarpus 441]
MAPRSVSEGGEMQTKTVVGIVLALVCFICLVLSIWTLSYCFPRRKQTSSPYPPQEEELPTRTPPS